MQSLEELPRVIAEAFHVANSGRPGPVLVDIPKDIQLAQGDLDPHFSMVADDVDFPYADIEYALQMLTQAQKPMLYVGGGVGMAHRAVVVSSRGGIHQGETTDAVTPYLRAVLGLMGIQEVEFIYAEGLDNRPHGRDAGIASARAQMATAR